MCIFSVYRLIGEFLGLPIYREKLGKLSDLLKNIPPVSPVPDTKFYLFEKILEKFALFLVDHPRLRFIIDLIFIIVYYNPFNLHFVFLQWIWKKFYYFFVFMNGNKDIFFKYFFNIDSTQWFAISSKFSYWFKYVLQSIFIFPFLRMMFFPSYIKEKILMRHWYEFFKIRFIAFFYSVVFFYNGISEFISNIPFSWKIVIVYVYFAVLLPLFSVIPFFRGHLHSIEMLNPKLFTILISLNVRTLSYRFLFLFIKRFNSFNDNYISRRYHYSYYMMNIDFYYMNCVIPNIHDKDLNFWIYEKSHAVPPFLYCYRLAFLWDNVTNFEFWYQEGIKLYGKDFERTISPYRQRLLDWLRCMIWIYFDCNMKLGFEEQFVPNVFNDPIINGLSVDNFKNCFFLPVFSRVHYLNIPKFEFNSLCDYKNMIELIKYFDFFCNTSNILDFIGPLIERDSYILGMPVGFSDQYVESLRNNLNEIANQAQLDYMNLFNEKRTDGSLLCLIEIDKFMKKWGKVYILPPNIMSDDQEYWWKRKT